MLLGGGGKLTSEHHLQGRQPVEAPVPRLVHDPHASAADLGQDVVVRDLPGDRMHRRFGYPIVASPGIGCRLPKTQSANRRAAVGRADQRLIRVGLAVLETLQ